MPNVQLASTTEELGYFYDTIHGRVALEDLPNEFHEALKSALRSKSLDRLKRISQLGHTSVSFFSATHTRFSHAVGSMLVMNKLFQHVNQRGIDEEVFNEVGGCYPNAVKRFGTIRNMVHCHLLLVALYQDVGELPFQKVTSLFFSPVESDVNRLANAFPSAKPREWSAKNIFSVLSYLDDVADTNIKDGFADYDIDFLVYLLTRDNAPTGSDTIRTLQQMVDAVIDADRLDYVYRDAAATIGSLSRPDAVLESVVRYECDHVIVNDPRPVTDFLSTRMRLWTFVYSSADARFRQVLLKTVLDGRWDRKETEEAFKQCDLDPELPFAFFRQLNDNSLMERIGRLHTEHLEHYRRYARDLLLHGTLGYECRVLKRGNLDMVESASKLRLPDELFFDLLSDHGRHQLYRPDSVRVKQALTSRVAETVRLEDSAGAFSPLFSDSNSPLLVPDGYYVFLPPHWEKRGGAWNLVHEAIRNNTLFPLVVWEDARRSLGCPSDTCTNGFEGRAIGISYCARDYPVVVRIVRELFDRKRRYRIFLRPFDGTGDTSLRNSKELVKSSEAVLAVVSVEYLQRALEGNTCISAEVGAMHERAKDIPVVPIGVDERRKLNAVPNWNWGNMNEAWRGEEAVISNDLPLRTATAETLRAAIDEALRKIEQWKK